LTFSLRLQVLIIFRLQVYVACCNSFDNGSFHLLFVFVCLIFTCLYRVF